MRNFIRESKRTLVQQTLAKGGTDVFSGLVDMQGYDNVTLLGICSSANSTGTFKLNAYDSTTSTANTTSNGLTLITGATVTSTGGQEDGLLTIEIVRPQKRYVGSKITRSAAVEYAGTVAIQTGPVRRVTSTKQSTSDLQAPLLVMPASATNSST
jgi:hypothetical protein